MTDYGIEVADVDVDVEEAAAYEITLKSGQTIPKEFTRGTVTMSTDPTTVTHDLGYTPQFLAWSQYPDYPDYEGLDTLLIMTGNYDAGAAYINSSNLSFNPAMAQGTTSIAKYYVFYEALDATTPTAIMDNDSYGMDASIDGVDVEDANLFEQTFNSKKNTMKIIQFEFTSTGSGNVDVPVSHGLNVIPGYLIFFKVGSGKWYTTWEKENVSGANVQVGAISETSNIYVQIMRTASCTVSVIVYAFVDPGN